MAAISTNGISRRVDCRHSPAWREKVPKADEVTRVRVNQDCPHPTLSRKAGEGKQR
jgi:hypothetical protein